MQIFDVQSVGIPAPFDRVFAYVADAGRLPEWTSAFKSVSRDRAVLETPNGQVKIGLHVRAYKQVGTIDWTLTFPDGSTASALSRVVGVAEAETVFTFLLLPPPAPLERLEGTLKEQSRILREELDRLKKILAIRIQWGVCAVSIDSSGRATADRRVRPQWYGEDRGMALSCHLWNFRSRSGGPSWTHPAGRSDWLDSRKAC